MLSLSNVSVEMASSYFEHDDYYSSEDGPAKAEFFGEAAGELGLSKEFNQEAFQNLLHGLSPDGEKSLIQVNPRRLSDDEVAKIAEKFESRLSKKGISLPDNSYINNAVIEKAKLNGRHFTRDESKSIYADVARYVGSVPMEPEQRRHLKKASISLVKSLSKSGHRAGLDCTFSAPKSISVSCLVGGNKELLEAHKAAVNEAMAFIESRLAGTRVGGKNDRIFARTGNVVGAKFTHGTSREGDPQLHTHCVIMNLTKQGKDTWRAMHTDPIYQYSKLSGLIYQNKLAELTQKLGYEIEVKPNGTFELKGYTETHLSVFSKRRQQVLEHSARSIFEDMKRSGLLQKGDSFETLKADLKKQASQKMNRVSVKIDRKVKAEIKSQDLKIKWQSEASECRMSHPLATGKRSIFGKKIDTDFAEEHLTERKAVNKKLDFIVQALSRNLGRAPSEAIISASLKDFRLETSIKDPASFASINHALKEAQNLALARAGKNTFTQLKAKESIDCLAERCGYTADQKSALNATILSKDQVIIWNGVAGSGKTWALKDVKSIAAGNGYKVLALAPDATSAAVLGEALSAPSKTVHSFIGRDKVSGKTLLIVDEAGKLSTHLMHELLQKIKGTKARLILSGDHRQLGAVEAGNPYKALLRGGLTVAQLAESVRQKSGQLKTAVDAISTQRSAAIKRAIEGLQDKIVERKTPSARVNLAVKMYEKMPGNERKNTLIIADTNRDRELLTIHLREKKKELGELSRAETDLKILLPKDLTRAQKRSAEYFSKGDILISSSQSGPLKRGQQYTVVSNEKGRITVRNGTRSIVFHPSAVELSVYRLETIKVAKGDKLEWRRNHQDHKNREELMVKSIARGHVILNKGTGETVRIDLKRPQFIDYAHVTTTYSSQGKTAGSVIALTHANTSKESFYVAVSRAKHDVRIITDDKHKLMRRAIKSSAKENALEHLEAVPRFNFSPAEGKAKDSGIALERSI